MHLVWIEGNIAWDLGVGKEILVAHGRYWRGGPASEIDIIMGIDRIDG